MLAAALPATAAPPQVLLVLMDDPPALVAEIATAKAAPITADTLPARRARILAARHASFAAHRPATDATLRGALPTPVRAHVQIEALPVLNAYLLYVPANHAIPVHRALQSAALRPGSAIAYVETHGPWPPAPALPDREIAPRDTIAASGAAPLVLALIDAGADPAHPWLADGLGEMHFQPGTPGGVHRRFLRSHGTAMLGIYAGQALGIPLQTGDIPLWASPSPGRFGATLVAQAGPETRHGRTALLRALAWLGSPTDRRPLPDLLNYSQGNGAVCEAPDGRCARVDWHGVTRVLDRLSEELAVVVVKSAGNRGYSPGNSLTVPGETFNGITVGNMHAFDWRACAPEATRARHKVYRTSSVAPPDGPRLLDLVAPGVRIATAGVDPAYCRQVCAENAGVSCAFCARLGVAGAAGFHKVNTGTSPAAAVAGSVAARVLATGLRDPLAVKALLVNTADAWTSGGAAHPRTGGDGDGCRDDPAAAAHAPYPHGAHYDRSYGWGYLNDRAALAARDGVVRDAIAPDSARCYALALAPGEKVTLAWQRRVGRGRIGGPDGWWRLTRLDLALLDPGGSLLVRDAPPTPDDNVLQVSIDRRLAGTTTPARVVVRVSATGPIDGAAREPFALAAPRAGIPLPACPAQAAHGIASP